MVASTAATPRVAAPPPAAAAEGEQRRSLPSFADIFSAQAARAQQLTRERVVPALEHIGRRLWAALTRAYRGINDIWELARRESIPRLLMIMLLVALTIAAVVYY